MNRKFDWIMDHFIDSLNAISHCGKQNYLLYFEQMLIFTPSQKCTDTLFCKHTLELKISSFFFPQLKSSTHTDFNWNSQTIKRDERWIKKKRTRFFSHKIICTLHKNCGKYGCCFFFGCYPSTVLLFIANC